jgi:translation initiation factor 1
MPVTDAGSPLLADPFKGDKDNGTSASSKDYVHIRVQQRNGRKSLTTVQVSFAAWGASGPCVLLG